MIEYNNLRDVKIGDRVKVNTNYSEPVRRGLDVDDVYTIIDIHPITHTGGTVTVEGVSNPNASANWVPGSYGFGIFGKVADAPTPTNESENHVNYIDTQRADDFRVGQKVIIRGADSVFVASQDRLKPGEVYTIDRVEVVNPDIGSGQFYLAERSDGPFDGAFGHLLFDHAPTDALAYPPIESYSPGDRVEIVGWDGPGAPYWDGPATVVRVDRSFIAVKSDRDPNRGEGGFSPENVRPLADEPLKVGNRIKITAGHEAFRGRTGVIEGIMDGGVTLTLDNPPTEDERVCVDPNGGLWNLASIERTTDGWENDLMPVNDDSIKVGDRVRVTEAAGRLEGVDYVGVVTATDSDRRLGGRVHPFHIALDDKSLNGGVDFKAIMVERIDESVPSPDLSDKEVRKGLPTNEAYPIGSVWNHISSGGQPVTITGYAEPTRSGREQVTVSLPKYLGQQPYEGSWVRGALDEYGTFISLPDDSNTLESSDALASTVDTLRNEIESLKQAAADERRRLCAEIDDLKSLHEAAVETRVAVTEERDVLTNRLSDALARATELTESLDAEGETSAEFIAALTYVKQQFLDNDQRLRLSAYVDGWRDAKNRI